MRTHEPYSLSGGQHIWWCLLLLLLLSSIAVSNQLINRSSESICATRAGWSIGLMSSRIGDDDQQFHVNAIAPASLNWLELEQFYTSAVETSARASADSDRPTAALSA